MPAGLGGFFLFLQNLLARARPAEEAALTSLDGQPVAVASMGQSPQAFPQMSTSLATFAQFAATPVANPAFVAPSTATVMLTMQGEVPMKIGDGVTFTCTVKDVNGNLVDPGVVTATVHLPDGSNATPTVARQSTGIYVAPYTWTEALEHVVRFQGTSPYPFMVEQIFQVDPSLF